MVWCLAPLPHNKKFLGLNPDEQMDGCHQQANAFLLYEENSLHWKSSTDGSGLTAAAEGRRNGKGFNTKEITVSSGGSEAEEQCELQLSNVAMYCKTKVFFHKEMNV